MVLFYAWTDTQLINSVNTRCNFFKQEKAELLVLRLNRISEEYIKIIQRKKIFNNVYILELPIWYLERKRKGIREKAGAIFNGIRLLRMFNRALNTMIGCKVYDLLLSGAFWSETMNVFRYLKKNNPRIELGFVEEGLSFYNGVKDWLYRTSPSLTFRGKVRGMLYYGFLPYKAKKCTKYVYMYYPKFSEYGVTLKGFCLPPILPKRNQLCYDTLFEWKRDVDSAFIDRSIFYILDAPRMYMKFPYKYVYYILEMLLPMIEPSQLVLRLHPVAKVLNVPFEFELDDSVYIDSGKGNFELLGIHLDLSRKIFIVNNSSSVYYLKMYYDIEPFIIFVHHLCLENENDEREKNDRLISQFRLIYSQPERLAVPKNEEQFKENLRDFQMKIKEEEMKIFL